MEGKWDYVTVQNQYGGKYGRLVQRILEQTIFTHPSLRVGDGNFKIAASQNTQGPSSWCPKLFSFFV